LKSVSENIILYVEGLLNSYSQMFFSKNKLLAFLILSVSFFDIKAGVSGVIAIAIGQIIATLFNFNKDFIRDGSYTYNSVLTGIAVGAFYEWSGFFFIMLAIASILVFFLTVWFSISFGKRGLPYLSVPFLVTIWITILGCQSFYTLLPRSEIHYLYPQFLSYATDFIAKLPYANVLYLYFRSLGAVFFQYNDLAGIIIAIGLLIYSRIGFILSIIGFLIGYFFYFYLKGDFTQLIYSYIGFNFILTAIALGGFYIVPSKKSYALLLFTMPIVALLISAFNKFFISFNLPFYSLPFNVVVLLTIAVLAARSSSVGLQLVTVQQYSPERNHYKHYNTLGRFSAENYFQIALPVMSDWHISQGHEGSITHQKEWKHAWDFDIIDDSHSTFKEPGFSLSDYYCYNLPIVAPADGWVETVMDGIDENNVGKVNMEDNWGNTIIIKHSDYLFSKLSHLKRDTFKVKKGDYVKKGDVLAYLGNSGRSPEPHLHFQMQSTPFIGSKTILHPISYYLTKKNNKYEFHSFDIPQKEEIVSNIIPTRLLTESFGFIPGKTFSFKVRENNKEYEVKWEVFTTAYNQSYIFCHRTKSIAYFVNNGTVFYFTDFYGDRNSFLHLFYLSAYKIVLGYYEGIHVKDKMMIEGFFNPFIKALHDITAPFFHYCEADYKMEFGDIDHTHHPTKIVIRSQSRGSIFSKTTRRISSKLTVENDKISMIEIEKQNHKITATCLN
jgi:urea transporter